MSPLNLPTGDVVTKTEDKLNVFAVCSPLIQPQLLPMQVNLESVLINIITTQSEVKAYLLEVFIIHHKQVFEKFINSRFTDNLEKKILLNPLQLGFFKDKKSLWWQRLLSRYIPP